MTTGKLDRLPTSWLLGVIGTGAILAVVQLALHYGEVRPDYFPPPTLVAARLADLLLQPAFQQDMLATLQGWAAGLAIAMLIGIPLGFAFGSSRTLYQMTSAIVDFMRSVPGVALIPLVILVLGQGLEMKATLVAYATVWPILFNTQYGVHDVEPIGLQTARAFALPRHAVLRHVVIPSAAPYVFTGIRVSASIGLIVVVGAELLAGASNGLGAFILTASSSSGKMDDVISGAFVAGTFGVVVNLGLERVERKMFAWRQRTILDS